MQPLEPGLFDLAARRLGWLAGRQTLLAQNIANSDTPGYTPRQPAPFAAMLSDTAGTLLRNSPRHLAGRAVSDAARRADTNGRQPDGNSVSLDMQLKAIADTTTAQTLVTTIYTKYLAMFRLVIGHGNG
ncbi:MAG: flagellar biosynthesis protein FlgB [Rhodospirillales bacterium]|nr:flagellar biosynthesis protein FlgB [Rhodospirillales bacterium]